MDQYQNYIGLVLDGRYKIKRLVGVGGMAMVFEAEDTLRNASVAVKILKEEFATDEVSVQRFINESKAVSMLSHTNIVKIYDISVKGEHKYIVMEYIDGITLKNYMVRKGALSVKETISYSIQILRALEHAHLGGIIHRDIKPQNIMLLKNGQIKVTDFGIAKLPDAKTLTATDKAIGTVYYISPEQAAGEKGIDRRADLYSVGVMMYEMITGRLPFDGENPVSIALKQINEEAKKPTELVPTIPRGLEQIILFAMEKDKDKRFQTATQMIDLLLKVRENNAVVFRQKNQSSSAQNAKKNRKKTTMLPIAMGVITAFLLVAIVAALSIVNNVFFSEEADNTVTITVEDYLGEVYSEELRAELEKTYRLKVHYEYSETIESGKILRQNPSAGQTRKGLKGRPIADMTIYVSRGIEELVMEDYTYYDQRQATIDLKNLGFKVTVTKEFNNVIPAGCVISTVPAAGEPIARGASIVLTVSEGEVIETVVVPSFLGANTVEAYEMLVKSDLRLGTITYMYDEFASYGIILEQSLAPSSSVPKGVAKINFVISKGPAPVVTQPPAPETTAPPETEAPVETTVPVTTEVPVAVVPPETEATTAPEVPAETTTATTKSDFDDWLSGRFNRG